MATHTVHMALVGYFIVFSFVTKPSQTLEFLLWGTIVPLNSLVGYHCSIVASTPQPTVYASKECFTEGKFPLGPSDVPLISGVAGHVTRVGGKVILPISIGEVDFNHPFYILDSMNHEIILGVDFLQSMRQRYRLNLVVWCSKIQLPSP